MDYKEFKEKSLRTDVSINNRLHFFSSHLSTPCAFTLYKIGLNANQATLLFGLLGIISALFFYNNMMLIGYVLFRLHIIVDMADGTIARAQKKFSEYADGFDKVNHILVNTLVILVLSKNCDYEFIMLLLPIFLVYYLFTKLFSKYPAGVHVSSRSIKKVILKNMVAFEGYIIAMLINNYFSLNFSNEINAIYSSFFLLLIIIKIRYMLKNE